MPTNTVEIRDPTAPFTSDERDFLGDVQRLLIHVTDPRIGAIAARVGYSEKEHAYGWERWSIAVGVDRPFSHYLSAAAQKVALASDASINHALRELDDFENKWFPRVRAVIRRYVGEKERDAVEQAFFDGLSQQPEGPAVVGSVALFLERLSGLEKSKAKGAKDARAALVQRGLDESATKRARELLDVTRASPAGERKPAVSDEAQRKAAERQRKAFDELKLWHQDWAETLRSELGYHDAVRLGIRENKGGWASRSNDAEAPLAPSDALGG